MILVGSGGVTANDLIKRALRKARIISSYQEPTEIQAKDAFDDLNDLIEAWSIEKLMVLATVEEEFTLVVGTAEYEWGDGATFDSDRPIHVYDDCYLRLDGTDYPVPVRPIEEYRARTDKSTPGYPNIVSYLNTYPNGVIHFNPPPSSAFTFHVRSRKALVEFPARTSRVSMEPGMRRALWTNLAVDLCIGYGKTASKELLAAAYESKDAIKRGNSRMLRRMSTPELHAMTRFRTGSITRGPWG